MKISNETKIGALTAIGITLLIMGYSFLRGAEIFSSTNKLHALYKSVDGLTVAKPVLVNGFQIGHVSAMTLQPDGQTFVELKIDRQYKVPSGTVAKLESTDLLGDKAIVLYYSNSNMYAEDGDALNGAVAGSLTESLQPIQAKAESLISKLDSSLAAINKILNPNFQKNIDRSFLSIANSLQTLEGTTKKIDNLVSTQTVHINTILTSTETVTANLKTSSENVTGITGNFQKVSDDIAKSNIKQTLDNANKAMADLQETIGKINNSTGSLGLLLNDKQAYNNIKDATANLNSLFIDLKANPKRYIHISVF